MKHNQSTLPIVASLLRQVADVRNQERKRLIDVGMAECTIPHMSTTAEKFVTEALGLPPPLRAFVAEKLIESLDAPDSPPLSAKWRKEIRRRCAEMDRSTVNLRPADKVFARAYAALT